MSSWVSFHQYFQVFHTKFNICFWRFGVARNDLFWADNLKQLYRSLQYDVKIILVLHVGFCPLVTRTSGGFCLKFILRGWVLGKRKGVFLTLTVFISLFLAYVANLSLKVLFQLVKLPSNRPSEMSALKHWNPGVCQFFLLGPKNGQTPATKFLPQK